MRHLDRLAATVRRRPIGVFVALLVALALTGCARLASTPTPAPSTTIPPRPSATITTAPGATPALLTPTPPRRPTVMASTRTATALPRLALDCGAVVRESLVLANDLTCPGDALTVGADGITLDLGGHTLTGPGPGSPTWPHPNLKSSGVKVADHSNVTVRDGTILKFSSGVYLDGSHGSTIEEITARGNYYGIYLSNGSENRVKRVTVEGNDYGLTIYRADRNRIVDNDASRQRHFSPGGYGIYMYGSHQNLIVGNTFAHNVNWGIWMSESSDNVFYHNNVIDNHPQVSDDNGGNVWYDAETREGNYWSDWQGKEIAGTGIGNHPYLIWGPGGATDPYPFVRENGWLERRQQAPPTTVTPTPTRSASGGTVFLTIPDQNRIVSATAGSAPRTLATLTRLASNLALAGDGRHLYVVDAGASPDRLAVLALDASTGKTDRIYPIPPGAGLKGDHLLIAMDRDGHHLHLLDGLQVVSLDLDDGSISPDVRYGAAPTAIFPSWKHQLILVANRQGNTIDVVWIDGQKVIGRIPISGAPVDLAANRAGTRVYPTIPGDDGIAVIETEQYQVVDHVGHGLSGQRDVATSPDGDRLYVLLDGGEIVAYDLLTKARIYQLSLDEDATRLVADGSTLVVAARVADGSGRLTFLDATTDRVTATLPLPGPPGDLVIQP